MVAPLFLHTRAAGTQRPLKARAAFHGTMEGAPSSASRRCRRQQPYIDAARQGIPPPGRRSGTRLLCHEESGWRRPYAFPLPQPRNAAIFHFTLPLLLVNLFFVGNSLNSGRPAAEATPAVTALIRNTATSPYSALLDLTRIYILPFVSLDFISCFLSGRCQCIRRSPASLPFLSA